MARKRKRRRGNLAGDTQPVSPVSTPQAQDSDQKAQKIASGENPKIDPPENTQIEDSNVNTQQKVLQEQSIPIPLKEEECLSAPSGQASASKQTDNIEAQKEENTTKQSKNQQVVVRHNWIKQKYFILANAIYTYLYFVGIQLLRKMHSRRRRIARAMHSRLKHIRAKRSFHRRSLQLYLLRTWSELCGPIKEFRAKRAEFIKRRENVKKYGTFGMLVRLHFEMAGYFLVRFWKMLLFLLNYLAPVGAALVMFWTVQYLNELPMALKVTYNGEDLGYIENERVFYQAENEMKARIINEAYIRPEDTIPKFELVLVESESNQWIAHTVDAFLNKVGLQMIEQDQLISANDLTDQLIQASGNEIQEADGLYISNRFVSAVTEGGKLLDYMDRMLEKHRTPEIDETAKIQFVKKVELRRGLYPTSSVKPLSEVIDRISGEERGQKTYTVIKGDNPLSIAAKNGITLKELVSLNPQVTESLFIGDELLISQSVPYLGVQVIMTERRQEEIDYQIEQRTNASQNIGWTRTVQKGKKGLREIVETIKIVDGVEVERTAVESRVIRKPVAQVLEVGGNRPLTFIPSSSSGAMPSGAWGWPTVGGSINMPWMGYYNHTGSDISWSGCYGSPILASQDGTVVVTKYSAYGYGYHVIIDHGGGYQTLYAHMSRIDVVPGQQVSKGQQLGLIGQTGRTTGPHLHFEIRVNGRPTNAAPYLYGG